MTPSFDPPPPHGHAVPASLQQLVHQLGTFVMDDQKNCAFVAATLIETAWDGSLWLKTKVGRNIPLADAIHRSAAVLDESACNFNNPRWKNDFSMIVKVINKPMLIVISNYIKIF